MSVTPHIILTNLRYFVVTLLAILQLYMHMMLLYILRYRASIAGTRYQRDSAKNHASAHLCK